MRAVLMATGVAWAVHRLLVRRPWPHRVPTANEPARSRARPRDARIGPTAGPPRSGSPTTDLVGCCELLAVVTGAGCTVRQAVAAVGGAGTGPVATALETVDRDVERGATLVEAIERLPDRLGPGAQSLASTLVVATTAGTPVAPALQRLADVERRRRRRAVEARIRRLPVLLLVPLTCCILPAFVVMTLVPVGLSAARSGLDLAEAPEVPPLHTVLSLGPRPGART